MADLVSTVWVRNEDNEAVAFHPGDTVPKWAREQMGDHCFSADSDAAEESPAPAKKAAAKRSSK